MKNLLKILIDITFRFIVLMNESFIKFIKKIYKYKYLIISWWLLFGVIINWVVIYYASDKIYYDISKLPTKRIGIAFGAMVWRNWYPSSILEDRLITTYNAYKNNKIKKILVSWDNSVSHYDEPTNMKKYLVSLWIKPEDIYIDYAWFDTYDSLYRARDIFWVTDAILFTQEYHLRRAIFVANELWIKSVWMSSDLREYKGMNYYILREFFSRTKWFLDVDIFRAYPKFLWPKVEIK